MKKRSFLASLAGLFCVKKTEAAPAPPKRIPYPIPDYSFMPSLEDVERQLAAFNPRSIACANRFGKVPSTRQLMESLGKTG